MADQLIQVVSTPAIDPGDSAVIPHNINIAGRAVVPDFIGVSNPQIEVDGCTETEVTVSNNSDVPAQAYVWLERKHSIQRAFGGVQNTALTPQPFILGQSAGGGSAAAGIFVWTLAKTWAEIYAEMQAVEGPKICLVEYDPAGSRVMTATPDADLNQVYFMGSTVEDIAVTIEVADTTTLATFDYGGAEIVMLRSKDIIWEPECTTTPLFTESAPDTEWVFIDLDGGGIGGANPIVIGWTTLKLRNNAYADGGASATGLFHITNNTSDARLMSMAGLNNRIFYAAGPQNMTLVMDGSCQYEEDGGAPSFNANITLTVNCHNYTVNATGELFRIAVDGGGNVVAVAV